MQLIAIDADTDAGAPAEPRIDTRVLAERLGVGHHRIIRAVRTEEQALLTLGELRLHLTQGDKGRVGKSALLNRRQAERIALAVGAVSVLDYVLRGTPRSTMP
jgi:hypothetical protein